MKRLAMCALLAALPALCASKTATKTTPPNAKQVETLSGKIMLVDPAMKLLVIQTPNLVPFDLVVTNRTRIRSGNQTVSLQGLAGDHDKNVTVQFVPKPSGNVAQSVRVSE